MIDLSTNEKIVAWLKAQFAKDEPGRHQAALARAIGRDRSAITKILAGEREVSAEELGIMRKFFGTPDGAGDVHRVDMSGGVAVVGQIGENVWQRPRVLETERPTIAAIVSEYPVSEQSAYKIAEPTPDGEFRADDIAFTVPFENYRSRPLVDDVYVVKYVQDGFERFSLRRAVLKDRGVTLVPLLPKSAAHHGEIVPLTEQIIGLVIGAFRPFVRR